MANLKCLPAPKTRDLLVVLTAENMLSIYDLGGRLNKTDTHQQHVRSNEQKRIVMADLVPTSRHVRIFLEGREFKTAETANCNGGNLDSGKINAPPFS